MIVVIFSNQAGLGFPDEEELVPEFCKEIEKLWKKATFPVGIPCCG